MSKTGLLSESNTSKEVKISDYQEISSLNLNLNEDCEKLLNYCGLFFDMLPGYKQNDINLQKMAVRNTKFAIAMLPEEARENREILDEVNNSFAPEDKRSESQKLAAIKMFLKLSERKESEDEIVRLEEAQEEISYDADLVNRINQLYSRSRDNEQKL